MLRDGTLAAHHPTMEGVTRTASSRRWWGAKFPTSGAGGRAAGEVRLAVEGLSGSRVPEPQSFVARAGEVLGFFGLVGAGRSELMRLVFGADSAASGRVAIDGAQLRPLDPATAIRSGLVLCPEDRKADGILQGRSITENVAISSRRHHSPFGIIRPAIEGATADRFIGALRIRTPSRRQDIVNLSGGNQQKVILARWLSEPNIKVLIADEPTRGIDVGAKAEIYEILYSLAEKGVAVVVISSELPEIIGISDRVLVMCDRRITAEFQRAEVSEAALLAAALPEKTAPRFAEKV